MRRVIAGAKSFLPRVTAEALEPKIKEQRLSSSRPCDNAFVTDIVSPSAKSVRRNKRTVTLLSLLYIDRGKEENI
ncbi:hypothetical protein A6K76_12640 [Caryophanon latum]|uniref:Uncharacterized protein n=1 Tax=Caryophanon latum TaxID=33977 RepID=A0A1C0YPV9_9BACL|nr:hypothetical protein A6K76_12640 [Caryophanon latum]